MKTDVEEESGSAELPQSQQRHDMENVLTEQSNRECSYMSGEVTVPKSTRKHAQIDRHHSDRLSGRQTSPAYLGSHFPGGSNATSRPSLQCSMLFLGLQT